MNPNTGSLKLNFPHLEVHEMAHTCVLVVAGGVDGEGLTLEEVGEILNLTRERIRQVEVRALLKLKGAIALLEEFAIESEPEPPLPPPPPEPEPEPEEVEMPEPEVKKKLLDVVDAIDEKDQALLMEILEHTPMNSDVSPEAKALHDALYDVFEAKGLDMESRDE